MKNRGRSGSPPAGRFTQGLVHRPIAFVGEWVERIRTTETWILFRSKHFDKPMNVRRSDETAFNFVAAVFLNPLYASVLDNVKSFRARASLHTAADSGREGESVLLAVVATLGDYGSHAIKLSSAKCERRSRSACAL